MITLLGGKLPEFRQAQVKLLQEIILQQFIPPQVVPQQVNQLGIGGNLAQAIFPCGFFLWSFVPRFDIP